VRSSSLQFEPARHSGIVVSVRPRTNELTAALTVVGHTHRRSGHPVRQYANCRFRRLTGSVLALHHEV
jgi:hypothetical protein